MRTMGMPTPGVVPLPAKTRPGTRRSWLAGRNGPDWKNVWARAKGVPRCMPILSQSAGVTRASTSTCVG